MTLEELLATGYFDSPKHLRMDLRMLVRAECVIRKLDVYYIADNGVQFLKYYPSWKLKAGRKSVKPKLVTF